MVGEQGEQLYAMSLPKLNREQRRKISQERKKEQRKKAKESVPMQLLICCPECKSTMLKMTRPNYFMCSKCGAEHSIDEMDCEL